MKNKIEYFVLRISAVAFPGPPSAAQQFRGRSNVHELEMFEQDYDDVESLFLFGLGRHLQVMDVEGLLLLVFRCRWQLRKQGNF